MHLRSSVKIEARERWLPFVQQLALSNGWDICGRDIEDFVDSAVPYLAAATTTTLESAKRVLTNYYQDAPLIQLLLHGRSHQSDGLWRDITGQCVTVLRSTDVESDDQIAHVAQIQDQFREILVQHNYQEPLWAVLVAFVHSVGVQQPKRR